MGVMARDVIVAHACGELRFIPIPRRLGERVDAADGYEDSGDPK